MSRARASRASGLDPESDAVRSLVTQYRESREELVAFASQVTRDPDAAEDIVEAVYVRLLERARRGRRTCITPSHVRTAVRHAALRWHRDRARRQDLGWSADAADGLPSVPTPEQALHRRRLRKAVDRVHAELPEHQAAVLDAIDRHGLSYAEAAERLGTTVSNVKKTLGRAREGFRRIWNSDRARSPGDP